jgi:hypothetical protein
LLDRIAAVTCASHDCPAVYVNVDNTGNNTHVLVQGYAVESHDHGIQLGREELLVRVPASLLLDAAARLAIRD